MPDGCFLVTGAPDGQLDLSGEAADPSVEAGHRAAAVCILRDPLVSAMEAQGLLSLNAELSRFPWSPCLARMEELGVGVDVAELTRLRDELTADCERLRSLVHEAAGEEFNVNSTKQLGRCSSRSWASPLARRPRPGSPPTRPPWSGSGMTIRWSPTCSGLPRGREAPVHLRRGPVG